MNPFVLRRGLAVAALAAGALLASCASGPSEAEIEAARLAAEAAARTPPPIALNESVAQAASIYVAFTRDMKAIEGGFADPEAVQAALTLGSAYNPAQVSRGLIAYASILALQSPEFVAGVRQYAGHQATGEKLVADIVANPRYASSLPGADAAASLIMAALRDDIDALGRAADSIENDAYAIQARHDPRRSWGVAQVPDRDARLAGAKSRSLQDMLPSAEESARLFAAAHDGTGLPAPGGARTPRQAPYPPAVENAIALAALAALGAAGDNARLRTDALQSEPTAEHCLDMSKLMLFQCLAASRPSYEDMFCVGRHAVRDLATCTRGAAMPGAIITVSDVVPSGPVASTAAPPPIVISPVRPPAVATQAPTPTPPAASATERLNRGSGPPD